jgi:DNA-binding NarL/FixJ family response regulator
VADGRTPKGENGLAATACPSSQGQYRRQKPTLGRGRSVSHGIDAAVKAMKPAALNAHPDRIFAKPQAPQLVDRNHPVLSSGELSDQQVGCGDFPVHITGKSPHPRISPPCDWETGLMLRVLIADDHGIVRSGLRLLLERQPDIEVVAEAADGAEARELAVRERPDLAILDVKMPKLTGLQATREIKEQAPEVSVLILSMHDDERYLFEALKAGASGYVLKAQADTDLLAAIRAVERGEPFLTPEAQRTLIKDVLERGSSGEEELTPREEEIVKLVAEAHTTKQIAELLHLSEKTVENHRANAMRKLGMRDRVELVRYAIRRGLIEP